MTRFFLRKSSHNIIGLLIMILLTTTLTATAQQGYPLNVTVVVKPPASSVFSEYSDLSNKVIITIQNTVNRPVNRIFLHGRLVKTSDEFITTLEDYYPSQLLSFNPFETKTLIVDPVQLRFLRKDVVRGSFPELLQQVLQTDLLPEGNWTLCVTAESIDLNGLIAPVSGEACFPVNITRANVPVITSPFNGQNVSTLLPNVIFAWTPPTGNTIGAQIVYDLYAVKVLQGQSPDDAINAAVAYKANNPLIKTNLTGNQYATQPYDLKLDTGYTYAVQVVARDLNKKIAFQNNGRSEVSMFTYGTNKPANGVLTTKMQPKSKPSVPGGYKITNADPVPISQVKGKLLYKFMGLPSGKVVNSFDKEANATVDMNMAAIGQGQKDNLNYNKDYINQSGTKPLANTKISLVLTYIFTGNIDNTSYSENVLKEVDLYGIKSYLKDMDKVIATTTTGPDGSFTFNFLNNQKELGLINDDLKLTTGGGEFTKHATGQLYKVLRLRVENKYYCSPDMNIKVNQWEGVDLGSMVSYVKTYNLKVRVTWTSAKFWDSYKGQGTFLSGVSTVLIRKAKPQNAPEDEGTVQTLTQKKVVSGPAKNDQNITDINGYVTFTNLVQHDPNNPGDRYFIKCKPDKKAGDVIFDEKEKSYYPLWDKDKKNFPFNSLSHYTPSGSGLKIPIDYGSNITWNSELVIKTYVDSISLQPARPRIAGIVEVAKNPSAKPFSGLKVVSLNNYKNNTDPSKLFTIVKTNSKGRYEFNNLEVETEGFNAKEVSKVIGPARTLVTKPDGFKGGVLPALPPLPPMKWGEQKVNMDFDLEPDGWIAGYVEDENGMAVESDVDIDGLLKTSTKSDMIALPLQGQGNLRMKIVIRQVFKVAAPSGDKRKISIQPLDKVYVVKDTTLGIKAGDGKQVPFIKFVVYKAKKRIRFQVLENSSPGRLKLPGSSKPVSGAMVKLDIPGKPIFQTCDQQGFVSFSFENMSENFNFIISPTPGSDYEEATYTLSGVKNSTQTVTYKPAYLKKAASITGTITFGDDKKPLEDAAVYIEMGNGKKLETKSDNAGKYILKGVPLTPAEQTIWASKPGAVPNIISQSKKITVKQVNDLDFNLGVDKELFVDKIYGFDVDIKSKEKQSDGTWRISGSLINLPSNDNFSLQDSKQTIPFSNLKIKKSSDTKNGIPVGIPSDNTFPSDIANLKLMVQQSFGVVQTPEAGDVLIISSENNKGKIKGKIAVQKSGFQISQNYIVFSQGPEYALSLTDKPGSFATGITSIDMAGSAKKKFGIADLKGKELAYTLLGFKAKADNQKSFLQDKNISLYTVLTVDNIPAMNPSSLEIDAGELVIHPDKFDPLNNSNPIKFKLENWEFSGNNWALQQNSSGINIPDGTIKTGVVDIPLKNVCIKPDNLEIGNAQVNGLTLAEVTPVKVMAANPVFGYNQSVGKDQKSHWELRIIGDNGQPGVTIGPLPGMKPGETIKFQKFSLISNGEQAINPGNQAQIITFYDVLKVKPVSFTSGDKYFDMACGLDLDIPQLEEVSGSIRFSKPAGEVKFELFPITVSLHGPGGVDFIANVQYNDKPQQLSAGKFTAMGTIKEKEGIVLKAILNRTTTGAWIEVNPKNQSLPLGTGQLVNIDGKMEADLAKSEWKNFTFNGNMQGFKGIQGDAKKTFTVYGSITANNEKIEVKNIPSGFGNIGITYDIANSRFIGDLQLDKQIGALKISGTANLVVDGGGWYFIAGGALQTPGIGSLSAGLMIGDYNTMPADVSQKLMQYAYDKNIPSSFKNKISGFFFTGMKELPIINIPNYSIDLGVISASFGAQAGLDARLWMGFDQAGNEYGIGAMAFAHAYLKGASITCTKFGADARAELGIKGIYTSSNGTFSLKGCGSFTISGSIQQCFPTPCWSDGICCEYCGGIGVSKGIKVELTLDSGGNTDLSFGFGNCSGQSAMTGNW
ncbi:MAG: carboxypeptidase regulatory-like domain-containing protein [Chitinophagaceae bacterium]|nr:carboxypeptidase regulatory-like domain-containing protein [Chitinophagaceae bacterium]